MIEKEENKEYLPMQGLDSFRQATVDLLLGKDHPAIKEVRALGCTCKRAARGPSLAPQHVFRQTF